MRFPQTTAGRMLLGVVAAAAFVGVGVAGTLFVLRPSTAPRETSATRPAEPLPPDNPPLNPENPVEDITINIAPDVLSRAGIQTATVSSRSVAREIRLPARVQPDAYRTVTVTPVASGRVMSVSAILGQRVQSGDPLATLQSPEVAAAESAVVSLRARQDAEAQRVARAERLLEIGAASKQELETARAEVREPSKKPSPDCVCLALSDAPNHSRRLEM
jgi:multidrug efflux pump subunit AcrA (membrane-fusion protein)